MEYGPPPLFRQGVSAKIRFIFFVTVSVILILIDGRLGSLDRFRSAMVSFTTPFVQLATLPMNALRESEGYFVSKAKLKNENDHLNEKNHMLSLEVIRLHEMQQENARLRRLVNAVPRTASKVVTAEVLGRVADHFTRRILINQGEKDGVSIGMPVIGAFGVLGQVTRVIAHQAEVTLLTDHRQQIAVQNSRTGKRFILAGTGDAQMNLRFVLPTNDIEIGDKLVTSGLDHLYPRQILTGTVVQKQYKPGDTYQSVKVEPTFVLGNVQFATVILRNYASEDKLFDQPENSTPSFKRKARR